MAETTVGPVDDLQFVAEACEQLQSVYEAYQAGKLSSSAHLTTALSQMREQLLAISLSASDTRLVHERETACVRIREMLGEAAPEEAIEATAGAAFCSNCGTAAGGRFCHACGHPLAAPPLGPEPAAFAPGPPPSTQVTETPAAGRSTVKVLVIAVAALVVVAAAGAGGWWFLLRGHSGPAPVDARGTLRNALTAEQTYWTTNQQFSDSPTDMSQIEPSIRWTDGPTVAVGNSVMAKAFQSPSAVLLTAAGANGHCYSILQVNGDSGLGTYYHDGGPGSVTHGVCEIPPAPHSLPANGSVASSTPDGWGTSF